MKKRIFLDDSILFFLTIKHPLKKEIYDQLSYFIKNNYYPVSSVYSLLKIQNIFLKLNQLSHFFEFIYDLEQFLENIYPLDQEDYKEAIHLYKQFNIDFDLAYYIAMIKKHQIDKFYSVQFKDKREQLLNQFNISMIYPYG